MPLAVRRSGPVAVLWGQTLSDKAAARPDYPYYNGMPVAISPGGWGLVVAGCALGFLVLTFWPFPTFPLSLVSAGLFTLIPLLALMVASGWHPPAIFRRLGLRDLGIAVGFGLLTLICSFGVGLTLSRFIQMTQNEVAVSMASATPLELVMFLSPTLVQLVGEELVTILPLLAVLWLCVNRFGMSRRAAIIVAVAVSTVWFAALHLPTYNWNILQCLLTIGTARIVLTMAYLLTRNVWVSSIAHIINDWTLFFIAFGLGHGPIGIGG
jgi:membrane protease YdiL (CAAX protease family)